MALQATLHYFNAEYKQVSLMPVCEGKEFISLDFDAGSFKGEQQLSILASFQDLRNIRDILNEYLKAHWQCPACKKVFPAGQEGASVVGGYTFCSSECERSYDHVLND